MLLHDLAYADFDFARRFAPSIFDCGVDREVVKSFAVEVFSMSKSYNMPGWRIAYMVGQRAHRIAALAHLKTYLDYGTFAPAAIGLGLGPRARRSLSRLKFVSCTKRAPRRSSLGCAARAGRTWPSRAARCSSGPRSRPHSGA